MDGGRWPGWRCRQVAGRHRRGDRALGRCAEFPLESWVGVAEICARSRWPAARSTGPPRRRWRAGRHPGRRGRGGCPGRPTVPWPGIWGGLRFGPGGSASSQASGTVGTCVEGNSVRATCGCMSSRAPSTHPVPVLAGGDQGGGRRASAVPPTERPADQRGDARSRAHRPGADARSPGPGRPAEARDADRRPDRVVRQRRLADGHPVDAPSPARAAWRPVQRRAQLAAVARDVVVALRESITSVPAGQPVRAAGATNPARRRRPRRSR